MDLTVVILAKNEAKQLENTLKTLQFCDEIIVIDDNSEDKTVEIAEKSGAIVFKRALNGDFASQRNFGLEKARGEWVLFVDADEVMPEDLKKEIQKVILEVNNSNKAYHIKRRDIFWGKELRHGEVSTAYKKGFIRLVKKGSGLWHGSVHEVFFPSSKTGALNGRLIHNPHPSIKTFLLTINAYSDLRAQELFTQGKKASLAGILFSPIFKFIYTYFLKRGFLDGPAGFAYSFMMSFHSFLVRSKLFMKYQS